MKNQFILTVLVCLSMTFMACNGKHKDHNHNGDKHKHGDDKIAEVSSLRIAPTDTLSLGQFNDYIARWDKNSKSYMEKSKLTYFSMPKIDLTQFHNEMQEGVRFYIGMDSLNMPHIILIGTDEKGVLKSGLNNHIYDITKSCPPNCENIVIN